MNRKYDRKETWEKTHGGAPVKCVLDVSKNIKYFFDQAVAVDGMTTIQSRILGHIHMEEMKGNAVFQRDIEEIFRIKRSSVTSVLQLLEKKGYIQRESVQGDARLKKLLLTDEGRRIRECTMHKLENVEKEMRNLFTEEEFQAFLNYMSRIDQKAMEIYYSKEETND